MQAIAALNIIAAISDIYVHFKNHICFLFPFLEKKTPTEYANSGLIISAWDMGRGCVATARSFVSYGNAKNGILIIQSK